jgi:hypothetical protein
MGFMILYSREIHQYFNLKERKKLLRFRGEKHEKDLGTHAAGNVSGWKCIGSANSAGNTP